MAKSDDSTGGQPIATFFGTPVYSNELTDGVWFSCGGPIERAGVDVGASDDFVIAWVCPAQGQSLAQRLAEREIAALPVDPMERVVDGLSVRECLARYEARCREYVDAKYDGKLDAERLWWQPKPSPEYERESKHPTGWRLTDEQRDAARVAWSQQLKRKQAEQREKERAQLCVDDDRWEP